jgi:peptidoglycan hydrolase-like protein with peptidoglycan-binding domain
VPGISGDDVRQLERALKRLGFDPGVINGVYDQQTSEAVGDWYSASGWQPFESTADQLANIRALERELSAALNSQLAAEAAVASAALSVQATRSEMWANGNAAEARVQELQAVRDKLAKDLAPAQDRAVAEANIAAAQAAASSVYTSGQAAIQAAEDAQAAAEREAETAAALVAQLTADLETARHAAGVKVPIDEIIFLPALPVRVEQLNVAVGEPASGPVMVVTNNQLAIDSSLPLEEAPLVRPDLPVAIDEPDLGIKASGVVSRVAETPGTNGVDGFHIYFETLVEEATTSLEGFSLRLTIPVQSTGGEVLVVPISAVTLAADGGSRVQVESTEHRGSFEYVVVEPGLSADGFVEVTPVEGTLEPGQLVVIGFEQQ